jgi:hypothetical protein
MKHRIFEALAERPGAKRGEDLRVCFRELIAGYPELAQSL